MRVKFFFRCHAADNHFSNSETIFFEIRAHWRSKLWNVDVLEGWSMCDKDVLLPAGYMLISLTFFTVQVQYLCLYLRCAYICIIICVTWIVTSVGAGEHGAWCDGVVTVLADVTLTLRLH